MLFAWAWSNMGLCLSAAWNGGKDPGIKEMRVYLGIAGKPRIKKWNIDNNYLRAGRWNIKEGIRGALHH